MSDHAKFEPEETALESASPVVVGDTTKYIAEAIGTFLLVFCSVGTAVFAGAEVGNLGVALAFGLTLGFLVYAIGPISGCHVNPAVTLAQLIVKHIEPTRAALYVVAQVIGGLIAGLLLYAIASGLPGFDSGVSGLGGNGFGDHSPSAITAGNVVTPGYGLASVIVIEVILTGLLIFVVLATTDQISEAKFAGLAIGAVLAVIHLVSIPIDNTSVNPARSIAVAFYQTGALGQLWVFIVFPLIGGALGALAYLGVFGNKVAYNS